MVSVDTCHADVLFRVDHLSQGSGVIALSFVANQHTAVASFMPVTRYLWRKEGSTTWTGSVLPERPRSFDVVLFRGGSVVGSLIHFSKNGSKISDVEALHVCPGEIQHIHVEPGLVEPGLRFVIRVYYGVERRCRHEICCVHAPSSFDGSDSGNYAFHLLIVKGKLFAVVTTMFQGFTKGGLLFSSIAIIQIPVRPYMRYRVATYSTITVVYAPLSEELAHLKDMYGSSCV